MNIFAMQKSKHKTVYCLLIPLLLVGVVVLSSCNKGQEPIITQPTEQKTTVLHKNVMTEITGTVLEMDKNIEFAEIYLMPLYDTIMNVNIIDDAIAVATARKEIRTMTKLKAKYPNSNYDFWINNYRKAIKTVEDRHNISAEEIVEMAKHIVDTITYCPKTICFTTDSVGHFSKKIKSGKYLLLVFGNMEYYSDACDFVFRKRTILQQIDVGTNGLKLNLLLSTVIVNKENGDIKHVGSST